MPDRWIAICRRLAPASHRERVFDPVVADLAAERAERFARAGSPVARAAVRARFGLGAFAAALGCRRIAWRETGLRSIGRQLASDLRHAARFLFRRPAFTLAAVLTLALGVGANAAIFSYVNHLLLSSAPVPDATGLVRAFGRTASYPYDVVSFPTYRDLRDGVRGLDLAAHVQTVTQVGDAAEGEARTVELVTGNFFRVLRLTPLAGRALDDRDTAVERSGAVAVVSASYWRSRLAADPGVVGRTIQLASSPFEIIGVAPDGFHGTYGAENVDFWVPLSMHGVIRPRGRSYETRGWGWLQMIGRVDPGRSMAEVRTGLDRIADDLHRRFDTPGSAQTAFLISPARLLAETERRRILPVLGAVFAFTVLLLVVTCANLAGLMQARLLSRAREVAIRISLGSSRGRLVRLWLTESALVAMVGGAVGLLLARGTTEWLSRLQTPAQFGPALRLPVPFDWRVVGFTLLVSLVAVVLFGWTPAMRASRSQPVDVLKDVGGTVTSGRRHARWRKAIVAVQVAVSVVLLVTSVLLARSLRNQQVFDPGFDGQRLALVHLRLINRRLPDADARDLLTRVRAAVRRVPGVTQVTAGLIVPLDASKESRGLRIPGYQPPDATSKGIVPVDYNIVDAEYFATMGIPIVSGRSWESASGAREVVINQTMARKFWPGRDPIGLPVELAGDGMFTVAGVVRDIAYYSIGDAPRPYVYFPDSVLVNFEPTIHARVSGSIEQILPAIQRAVRDADARLATSVATSFEHLRSVPLFPGRALAGTALAFGVIALLLTIVGLYGVVSASVGERTREIGVRMALGAESRRVLRDVLGDALRLTVVGAAIGFLGGYLTAVLMKSWLFETSPFDPIGYLAVAALVGSAAIAAAWFPARRAASIDPVEALR